MKRLVHVGVELMVLVLLLAGCASHPPTRIEGLERPQPVDTRGRVLDFVVEAHYLGSVDNPADTKKSGYARDEMLVRSVLSQVLAPYGNDLVRVVDSTAAVTSPHSCEMKIQQYVAWIDILYALLPIPHSSNESICATADLKEEGRLVSHYSECAFNRQRGFWAWSGRRNPPAQDLRLYVTKKVTYQVLRDFMGQAH